MKRFALGDLHGAYRALRQVFELSSINYNRDQLIVLGDVADGWPDVKECFDELLKFKNLIYILGNHDYWLLEWFSEGKSPYIWLTQGGQASVNSYGNDIDAIKRHETLLKNARFYYRSDDNKVFVHGGFNWHKPLIGQQPDVYLWDRHLFETACQWQKWNDIHKPLVTIEDYNEIFIGHTSTCYTHRNMKPVHVSNVWNLDQGAGWEGKLTLMNVDTKEYWQSDIVKSLYPDVKGR